MKEWKFLLIIALLACGLGWWAGGARADQQPQTWEVGGRILPTSATNPCGAGYFGSPPCGQTLHVDSMTLVNPTAGAITVTVQAVTSTADCGNAACYVWVAQIAANTSYTVPLLGSRANGGFTWSATSTGVHGWIAGH